MPKVGEVKPGKELGYKGKDLYIGVACSRCGKVRWKPQSLVKRQPTNNYCRSCSNGQRTMEKGGYWKGGRYKNPKGYIEIKLHPDDFFFPMANKERYVLEHRLAVAKSLNRCLLPWEIVHHINNIRDDNRLENLKLLPHRSYQLVETVTKSYIAQLERRVKELERKLNSG